MHAEETLPPAWREAPVRAVWQLAWPLLIQLASGSAMGLVDTALVGRLGPSALGAAGIGGMTAFSVSAFGSAIFTAARVEVAEAVGRGDTSHMKQTLRAFLILGLGLSLVSWGLVLFGARALETLIVDAELRQGTLLYLTTRAGGLPAVVFTAALGQWLTAQGNSRPMMRAALVSNALHLPILLLLVQGAHLGLRGAALSTDIAQWLELIAIVPAAQKRARELGTSLLGGALLPRGLAVQQALSLARMGLMTAIERVLDLLAFTAIPVVLARGAGTEVAAHQVVSQFTILSFLPMIAIGDATGVLVSQARGASALGHLKPLVRAGLMLSITLGLFWGSLFALGPTAMPRLFTDDPNVAKSALRALTWAGMLQLVNGPYNLFKGSLRGLRDFQFVAWTTIGCAWIITPPLTYLWGVRLGLGARGAWAALCVECTLGLVILIWRMRAASRAVTRSQGALEWPPEA